MKLWSLGVAVLSGMIAIALTGCSIVTGITAVTVREGHVIALVRMCGGVTSNAVLYGTFSERSTYATASTAEESFADIDLGVLDEVLVADSNDKYWIQSSASDGDGGMVAFSARDLEDLRDGEVLIDGSKSSAPDQLTATDFDAVVDKKCDAFKH